MLFVSGEHTAESHSGGKGLLTVKQQHAIRTAVRSAPLQSGGAVHANLKNFSPGRHVPTDRRSMDAVARMVRKERKELMAARLPGHKIDGSEGAMTKLAKAISLKTAIERHNDPDDDYHMDAHQVVCCGYQFKDGVRLMVLSTPSLIANMARAIECGWQVVGHWDGAFNWCNKDFGLLAFGLNRMGAHYNPVTITIANSESRIAIEYAFKCAEAAFFSLYKSTSICSDEACSFCSMIKQPAEENTLLKEYLLSPEGLRGHYNIDKPCADQSAPVHSFAKDKFGKPILQCGQHLTGEFRKIVFCCRKFRNFGTFPTYKLIFRNCLWQRSPGGRSSSESTLFWRRTTTSSINLQLVCSNRPPRRSCALCKSR